MRKNLYVKPNAPKEPINLGSRYNRGMVISQLRELLDYTSETKLINDANKIHIDWSGLDDNPDKRPRFFNVRHALKLKYDLYVLTSTHHEMEHKGSKYEVLQLRSPYLVYFGLPISKTFEELAGSRMVITRILLTNGVGALIKLIETLIIKVDSYEDRDTLKANSELLKELEKAMLPEGMLDVSDAE